MLSGEDSLACSCTVWLSLGMMQAILGLHNCQILPLVVLHLWLHWELDLLQQTRWNHRLTTLSCQTAKCFSMKLLCKSDVPRVSKVYWIHALHIYSRGLCPWEYIQLHSGYNLMHPSNSWYNYYVCSLVPMPKRESP